MKGSRALLGGVAGFGVLTLWLSSAWAQGADSGYRVFRPDAPGPHPAVALVSGCNGFAPSFAPKAYVPIVERLQAQGFVVIFVDYLGRRGLLTCFRAPIAPADVTNDLVAATAWLRSQPFVDKARITAMGWSYGGGAILKALADYTAEQLGVSGVVVYYPRCQSVQSWRVATPVLILLAGDDDITPGTACQAAVKGNATPEAVKTVVYPGALHGFDAFELPAKTPYLFGTIGHHPQAAAAALEEVQRFLKSTR